jgi:hypothetical protein
MNPIEPSEHLLARLNERLTDRELLVMRMRLGFTSQASMTLQQIGTALNLTRERVRQIQHQALLKMADPQLNAALLVDSLVTTDQKPKLFGKSRLPLKTNAGLKQAVEQKLAVSDFEQIVVYFKNPVIGQDPVNKEFFTSDRHKLIATWARQDGETTIFLDDDSVIIASWNTREIKTIQWPSGQQVPPTTTAFANRMEEIKSRFPRAWSKWSFEEDQKLIKEFKSGLKIKDLCDSHGRARGGIISRLRKLDLISHDETGTNL